MPLTTRCGNPIGRFLLLVKTKVKGKEVQDDRGYTEGA